MKKIAISTLGCKVNQYESAAFQSGFEAAGCRMALAKETADIIVINTCTVTAKGSVAARHPAADAPTSRCQNRYHRLLCPDGR